MPNYGLTLENENIMREKAKTKKDGCFTFRGVVYRVQNKTISHYGYNGQIIEVFGRVNVVVGTYDKYYNGAEKIKNILKSI